MPSCQPGTTSCQFDTRPRPESRAQTLDSALSAVEIAGTRLAIELGMTDSEVRVGLAAHRASLLAHARKLTRDPSAAEDLVQDTAVRALLFASSFESGTNLRGWLHQILQSVFVTRCRRRGRELRGLQALTVDPCAWVRPEPTPAMQHLSPRVASALACLPAGFRDVVQMVDVLDISYKDAARSLNVPLGTVMSRLHRGRRLLAELLAERALPNELQAA